MGTIVHAGTSSAGGASDQRYDGTGWLDGDQRARDAAAAQFAQMLDRVADFERAADVLLAQCAWASTALDDTGSEDDDPVLPLVRVRALHFLVDET